MLKRALTLAALAAALCCAQEAEYGVSVPVTASGGFMDTHRFNLFSPSASPTATNFRLMFYPTVRLGKHWFAYAAIQARRIPYFYYDVYLSDRGMHADLVQGYVGYSLQHGPATVVFKAGQLVSAFGSFPLRYDDAENPLLDQPLAYITEVPVRSDQLACGTSDQLKQHYGSVAASCGGEPGRGPGLTPATLYGLLGAQAEISVHRFDGRLQLTNNSPSYPDWNVSRQYAQWTAGGGFTISQGFRIGASGFRGPYLERTLAQWLPAGTSVRSFPATGMGLDGQWARGRLSATGELQSFHYESPNFTSAPQFTAGYIELKGRVTPRVYLAGREGYLKSGRVMDSHSVSADSISPTLRATELAAGCWLHPRVLLKVSYEFSQSAGKTGSRSNVVGVQLVASFRQLQWAWR